jgi:hypothetical protein
MDFSGQAFDVVHVHHPFLLGEMGLRLARQNRLPLVFTYHTLYERYTHYVPMNQEMAARTILRHTVDFCNMCDLVIAPTRDLADALLARGISARIEILPTGIELERYGQANRQALRSELGLGDDAPLLIHVGRLAKEKNLAHAATLIAKAAAHGAALAVLPEAMNLGWTHPSAKAEADEIADGRADHSLPSAWAVPAEHDNQKEPYGALWLENYAPVARDFRLWIAGASHVGWITGGPWHGRKCIGCSLVVGPSGEPVLRGRMEKRPKPFSMWTLSLPNECLEQQRLALFPLAGRLERGQLLRRHHGGLEQGQQHGELLCRLHGVRQVGRHVKQVPGLQQMRLAGQHEITFPGENLN